MDRYVEVGLRTARRVIVGVVGTTVLLVGILLLVLPGPAMLVIPIGLGILAIEFQWARRWVRRIRSTLSGLDASDPRQSGAPPDSRPPVDRPDS